MFINSDIVKLIVKYVAITITMHSMACPVWFKRIPPNPCTRSAYPTAIPNDEFFVKFRYWLVRGGTITLKAWGIITKRRTKFWLKPTDLAASVWPFETANIPALTTSAIKDAVYIERAKVKATSSGIICIPPLKLNPFNSGYSNETGNPVAMRLIKNVKIIIEAYT